MVTMLDLASRTGSREDAIAAVGDGVYLTSAKGCRTGFDLTIHISKDEDRRLRKVCDAGGFAGDRHLHVDLCEEAPLSAMTPGLETVAEYCRRPGTLLIHCVAGINRGPTLAILAKLARGRGLIAATAEVHDLTLVTRNVADFEASVRSVLNPWTG